MMNSRITIGGGGDREANFNLASRRDLGEEPVLHTHVLSTALEAPAYGLLVIHRFHALRQLLQPTAACCRWGRGLASGELHARGGFYRHGAARYVCHTCCGVARKLV